MPVPLDRALMVYDKILKYTFWVSWEMTVNVIGSGKCCRRVILVATQILIK